MPCPICDQKPANCDCTEEEKRQCVQIGDLQDEIERLRLTDAEREALHHVVGDVADITGPVEDTIRGLLERTK